MLKHWFSYVRNFRVLLRQSNLVVRGFPGSDCLQFLQNPAGPVYLRLVFLAVKRGQELLGGAVQLCAGSVWLNLYTAVEPEAQRDYASYLLYWNMIEHAVAEGGTILDLGRSRPESGTHRFKLQWASDDLIRQYTLIPVCGKIPAVSLDKSAGFKHEIWKRLPLQIAGPAGGFLRRSIPFA